MFYIRKYILKPTLVNVPTDYNRHQKYLVLGKIFRAQKYHNASQLKGNSITKSSNFCHI